MTKDKIICKDFYKFFYEKYKINDHLSKIIFEEFLFNENLNESEKKQALTIDFGYRIKYYLKKLYDNDTNVQLNTSINGANVIILNNGLTIAYFCKNPYNFHEYGNIFNHYNVEFYLILNKELYHINYKDFLIEYLKLIEQNIKRYNNNNNNNKLYLFKNNLLYMTDIDFEYDFKYEYEYEYEHLISENINDNTILRLKFSFKYMVKKNSLIDNILVNYFNNINIKRNAKYENNNKVKEIINYFKINFINNFLYYF